VQASAVPGTRTRTGHNAAAVKPHGSAPARQGKQEVQGKPKAKAKRDGGAISIAVQGTAKALKNLANQEKGLIGEHIVDYHELKRLGGGWPHDKEKGSWNPATVKKLNVDKRPVNLALHDLGKVNQAGIDAVWQHDAQLTVTEAKASASIGAVYGMGKFKEKKGQIPVVAGLSAEDQLLHYLLSDSSDKKGTQTPLMQMGVAWVDDRAQTEAIPLLAKNGLKARNKASYQRRVCLVTLESAGALSHVEALADIHLGKPEAQVHKHTDHDITKSWGAADIDAVDEARKKAHKAKAQQSAQGSSQSPKPQKPGKGKK